MIDIQNLVIGIILAGLISYAAYKAHALNRSGMWAAAVLGTVIMGLGGLQWAILLMGFFVSSSILSKMFKNHKSILNEKYAKGSERDAAQVLANGGIAGLAVLLQWVMPVSMSSIPWILCASALAAANADTWATELGALSPRPPRLITNLKAVDWGTSGGITLTGTLAALSGSALITLLAILFVPSAIIFPAGSFTTFIAITLAGLVGSLVDSLLGATLQAIYYCPVCDKETEKHPLHGCGNMTKHIRGLFWLNNDWVNTACTLSGALLALLFTIF